jgi:prophage regulatory protein
MSDVIDRIVRLDAVLDRTGLSRSTLYRKMRKGSFPQQINIGDRCVGWRESDLASWLRNPQCYSNLYRHDC